MAVISGGRRAGPPPPWAGGELGVDAGGAEEQQLLHAELMGSVEEVGLDQQVLVDEVGRVAVVGEDAAHPGGGQVDLVDGLTGEEVIDHRLVEEVQFGVAGWCAGS